MSQEVVYSVEPKKFVDFDHCEALNETGTDVLVNFIYLEEEVWVPKTVIHEDSEVKKEGDTGTIKLARCFAARDCCLKDYMDD